MVAKFSNWGFALLLCAGGLVFGAPDALAQYDGAPPMQEPIPVPTQQNQTQKPVAPKVNKEEEADYKELFAARTADLGKQIQLGENFAKKFPESRYLTSVYAQLAANYMNAGQVDKMFVAGEKALELNPDNTDVLSLLAMAMPRRVNSSTPDPQQQYQKAEGYARKALELLPNLPKPEGIDDAAFQKAKDDKLAMAHSGLGLILFQRKNYAEARTELTEAVKLSSSPDPVDYYLLGNANLQGSYYNDAAAAYEKCATVGTGALAAQCKVRAESAKKDAATKLGR